MTTRNKVLYAKPSITDVEAEYVMNAVRNGWGTSYQTYLEKFESDFAEYIGVKHALATSSCTGALHLGLAAIGIGSGDEVIMADSNWIATASPIVHLGGLPVLVDVYENSWCVSLEAVSVAISPKTKAIIATHLYGNVCELEGLRSLAEERGLILVEDAAEAIGSRYEGRFVGSFGNFGVFSFHGTKTFTTGEGGMLVTNDDALCNRVRTLNNHGRSATERRHFWPEEIGYKFRMSNLQAALGCAQLSRAHELVARKREIFYRYHATLGNLSGLSMNPEPPGTVNGYWMPTVVFEEAMNVQLNLLQESLISRNIDARPFFWPLSSTGLFETRYDNHVSRSLQTRALNLPSYYDMTLSDIDRVLETLVEFHHKVSTSP